MELENSIKMHFRQVSGIWKRVDSQRHMPTTLAEYLEKLNITIDDNTKFCRIERPFYDNKIQLITYRVYGGEITICINTYKE